MADQTTMGLSQSPTSVTAPRRSQTSADPVLARLPQPRTKAVVVCKACEHARTSPRSTGLHSGTRSSDTRAGPRSANTSPRVATMEPRHRRTLSPPTHRLANPARSSTGTFDQYSDDYYGRSPRDYVSSRLDKFYPSYAPSGQNDGYSSRSRRGTLSRDEPEYSPTRHNPRERDEHRPRKERHRIYKVDDTRGATLVDERDVLSRDYGYNDPERTRDRRQSHRSSARPRMIEEDEYSYTDAAGMYRDTEPRRARRRGSADRARAYQDWDSDDYYEPPRNSRGVRSRETDPRAERAMGGVRRHETLDEREISRNRGMAYDRSKAYDPYQAAERSNTYDRYLAPGGHLAPPRNGRPRSMMDLSQDQTRELDRSDDDDAPRRSRGRYKDEQIETRGFGLRNVSTPGSDVSSHEKAPLAIEAPPRRPTVDAYGAEGELLPPDPNDYMPKSTKDDGPRHRRDDDRSREHSKDYAHDQPIRRQTKESARDREQARDDREWRSDDSDFDEYYPRRKNNRNSREYEKPTRDRDSDDSERQYPAKGAAAAIAGGALASEAASKANQDRRDTSTMQSSLQRGPGSDDAQARITRDTPRERERDRSRVEDVRARERTSLEVQRSEKSRDASADDISREETAARKSPRDAEFAGITRDLQGLNVGAEQGYPADRPATTNRLARRDADELDYSSEDDLYSGPSRLSKRDRGEGSNVQKRDGNAKPDRHADSEDDEQADEDYRRRVLQSQQELSADMVPPPPPPGAFPAEPPTAPRALLGAGLTAEPAEEDGEQPRPREKSRVRIVEPTKAEERPAVKSILRKPTDRFPDRGSDVREGTLPLKEEAEKRGIPSDARWTKIKRTLVNPEALVQAKERFEERAEHVIVLRVLSKEEIQKLADSTAKIRAKREEEYERQRDGKPPREVDKDLNESDDTDDNDYEKRRHEHRERERAKEDDKVPSRRRDTERERDRPGHHERERERERDRDRERERERDRDRDRDRHRDAARDRHGDRDRA